MMELESIDTPTVVAVTAPWCSICRALRPDLDAVGGEFADTVRVVEINAASEPELAGALKVRGTPTLIGVRAGAEVLRHTGRLSKSELRELFSATADPERRVILGRHDRLLRAGAGGALVVLGAVGSVWPLWLLGGIVLATALVRRDVR